MNFRSCDMKWKYICSNKIIFLFINRFNHRVYLILNLLIGIRNWIYSLLQRLLRNHSKFSIHNNSSYTTKRKRTNSEDLWAAKNVPTLSNPKSYESEATLLIISYVSVPTLGTDHKVPFDYDVAVCHYNSLHSSSLSHLNPLIKASLPDKSLVCPTTVTMVMVQDAYHLYHFICLYFLCNL